MDLSLLSAARYVELFSLLVAQPAYNGSHSPAFALRFQPFPRPTANGRLTGRRQQAHPVMTALACQFY